MELTDVLRERIAADLHRFKVPGVSWAVIDGGELVDRGSAGVVEAGRADPVTPDTLFQACSISKPVAVFAMLRLVDRGLLELDEDVNRRLTSWQLPPTGDWQPVVTLRHLASHSAGLTVHGFPGYPHDAEVPTPLQVLDGVRPTNTFGVRVDTVPGTQFRYSGGGTVIIQQLLEDVSGTPFRELARELVLDPLGMSASDYAQPLPEESHARAATAHDEFGRAVEGRWHAYPELAAAGLWTTPSDLTTFATAAARAYAGADGALLSPEVAREMLTQQVSSSDPTGGLDALGLGLFLVNGGPPFGHSGGNHGFKCHLLAYRDTGQGAAVMTNGDNGSYVVQRAFAAIASSYGWEDYPAELDEPEWPDADELVAIEGTYELRPGANFTVARDEGRLSVTFPGQHPITFAPRSSGTFGCWTVDTVLRAEEPGKALVFVQNDEEITCPKVA